MLAPTSNDSQYDSFKKLQKKYPGIDVLTAQADALAKGTSENDEMVKAKDAKKAKELKAEQAANAKLKAEVEEKLKKDAKK